VGYVETEYLVVNRINPDKLLIEKAAKLLQKGEIIAFPTETVYGLGANALNPNAVKKIFSAKGRPQDNPLIVHIADREQLRSLVAEISPVAQVLMNNFWPGPLTLIFPKCNTVPSEVTAGLPTVAVRMPDHPVALALIRQANLPVAAPSANISGRPSPTSGYHVWEDLKGKIPLVLDGGDTKVGLESTVLDITRNPPVILRPGGVTLEDLCMVIENVELDNGRDKSKTPLSPGMKYRHYSPQAKVVLISGGEEHRLNESIISYCRQLLGKGKKVALLLSGETAGFIDSRDLPVYIEVLGSKADLARIAQKLFSAFRKCDLLGIDIILIEEFPEQGIGAALMNRIRKAASSKVIE
jgi:L-threonylcarbamoyladenylate synthase